MQRDGKEKEAKEAKRCKAGLEQEVREAGRGQALRREGWGRYSQGIQGVGTMHYMVPWKPI